MDSFRSALNYSPRNCPFSEGYKHLGDRDNLSVSLSSLKQTNTKCLLYARQCASRTAQGWWDGCSGIAYYVTVSLQAGLPPVPGFG